MKEYCLISVRKHIIVAKLYITKYQFEELTDDKFETLVNKWLLLCGGHCNIHVKNGDFKVKHRDNSETLYIKSNKEGFEVILSKYEDVLDVADLAQIIKFDSDINIDTNNI